MQRKMSIKKTSVQLLSASGLSTESQRMKDKSAIINNSCRLTYCGNYFILYKLNV